MSSKEKNDGDLRLKMPRFSEFERERALGMFMGGASLNDVARHFNVHRTIVKRLVNNLEEIISTRDRP